MKFWKKLQNPVALACQGFLVGGLVFFATPEGAPPIEAPATESILSTVQPAP